MKKAVIYTRYSKGQTESSYENELNACYAYAKENQIQVADIYLDRSAKTIDLRRLLKNRSKKNWDYVLVYSINRIARDRLKFNEFCMKLEENEIELLSVTEPITRTSESSRLNLELIKMYRYFSAKRKSDRDAKR